VSKEQALHYFRGEKKDNCAQALLKAFQKECTIDDELIAKAKGWGGGRAPDGLCGALYGAQLLFNDDAVRSALARAFGEAAGDILCKPIRKAKTMSCKQCVAHAATIAQQHLSENA